MCIFLGLRRQDILLFWQKKDESVFRTIKTNGAGSVESNIRSQIATYSFCNKTKHEALCVIMFFQCWEYVWHFGMDPDPRIRTSDQKHTDPTDPDPEHRYKVIKKSQNRRNQGFPYYFFLMMEGSGAGPVIVTKIRMRIREALKHMDPGADPDP
jgi:hypothetical protein